jgi:hypothetical protein
VAFFLALFPRALAAVRLAPTLALALLAFVFPAPAAFLDDLAFRAFAAGFLLEADFLREDPPLRARGRGRAGGAGAGASEPPVAGDWPNGGGGGVSEG